MKIKALIGLVFLLIFNSCGNKEAEERAEKIKAESLSIPQNISNVSAIGKIEPEQGLVALSSEKGGIVVQVLKNAGDSVLKDDVILILKASAETVNEDVVKSQIKKQKFQAQADFASIAQFKAQLDEKNNELFVSERLVKTGAETAQNIQILRKDLKVINSNLATAQKNYAASSAEIGVLQSQLKEAVSATSDMSVRAQQDGILVAMNAKPGAAVAALSAFGALAATGKMVVHGEIDEMFASKVKMGDYVKITVPGTNTAIAEGKISFLSPILDDKSIFYELSGEQMDRRIRSFKVELTKSDGLLINQKVQCDIKVD